MRRALPTALRQATRRGRRRAIRGAPAGSRHGYTLFEMVLVMALLAAALAVSYPYVSRLFAAHQLYQAGELVRVRIMQARVLAAETGLVYQFRYEPNGQKFILAPSDVQAFSAAGATRPAKAIVRAGMLPGSAVFESSQGFSGQGGGTMPESWFANLPDAEEFKGVSWSAPLLFQPDGSTHNAEVVIRDEQQNAAVRLSVRGLTGGVTASRVTQ